MPEISENGTPAPVTLGLQQKTDYGASVSEDSLTCEKCGERRRKDEFPSVLGVKGMQPRQPCKPCRSSARKERYRTSDEPARVWARNLARYGLTPADYEWMLADQDGLCATCRRPQFGTRRLCVDHNHETGQVRQLLCDPCNVTIGYIEKYDVPLDALVAYLARHRGAAS